MKEKISDNTEVLIFDSKRYSKNTLDTKFKRGIIITSMESDDISYYGSPWAEQIYYVEGEDGKIYTGTYENPVIGNHYFMTEEDYNKKIKSIENDNKEYVNVVDGIKQLKKTK